MTSARTVDEKAVAALDEALARAAQTPLEAIQHVHDPRRAIPLDAGGPPVWSVALCATEKPTPGYLVLTYGLSKTIDPASPYEHELSLRVPAGPAGSQPPLWPALLLRHLARYELLSGRELKAGELMSFAEPISRAPVPPHLQPTMPDTRLRAIALVQDPLFPGRDVRRVYGLSPSEQELVEVWSATGVMKAIGALDAALTTDLERADWAQDPGLVATVEDGSLREGSETSAILVPGVRWARETNGHAVIVPGAGARRLARAARARLAFGRRLLIHDFAKEAGSEVALVPSQTFFTREVGGARLEIGLDMKALDAAGLESGAPQYVLRFAKG